MVYASTHTHMHTHTHSQFKSFNILYRGWVNCLVLAGCYAAVDNAANAKGEKPKMSLLHLSSSNNNTNRCRHYWHTEHFNEICSFPKYRIEFSCDRNKWNYVFLVHQWKVIAIHREAWIYSRATDAQHSHTILLGYIDFWAGYTETRVAKHPTKHTNQRKRMWFCGAWQMRMCALCITCSLFIHRACVYLSI